MKRAYSFAAVFFILISWQAFAANPPPDPADALYNRVMELYGRRKFAEALPLAQEVVANDEKALGPNHLDFAKTSISSACCIMNSSTMRRRKPLTSGRLPYARNSF